MRRFEARSTGAHVAIVAAGVAVFLLDVLTPLGVAVWVLYLLPIALALFSARRRLPLLVAGACAALTAGGYFLSPPPIVAPWLPVVNRSLGIVAQLAVGWVGYLFVRAKLLLAREDWLRAGQAALARALEGNRPLEQVAADGLTQAATYLGAAAGALFVAAAPGRFVRCAVFGCAPDSVPAGFGAGEALGGRAARTGKIELLAPGAGSRIRLASSLLESESACVVAAPGMIDGECCAILELGFTRPAAEIELRLLEQMMERLAVAIRAAQARAEVDRLLAETRRQAHQLEEQSTALRSANEELQQQGASLRDSQAELELQQSELEQSNAELEAQSLELERRTEALQKAKEDLQARAVELEKASRYKSEFLANMSHELRTPLNSSLILAKLLAENQEGNLSPDQVRYAETIHAAGNDLLQLINDVLDLAKVEAGRVALHVEETAIARLVEEMARTFDPVAAQRGLRFERRVAADLPAAVATDPQRLAQILRNLLSNAFKFTEHGGVTLEITGQGGGIAFTVRDTGVGIAAEQQEAIFEAFRQVDAGPARRFGGTGLGLTISRELAGRLGGRISVESTPGLGSAFTFWMPLAAPGRPAAPAQLPPPRAPPAGERPRPEAVAGRDSDRAAATGAERLILVIEDDASFADFLCEAAREQGFTAIVAATAEDGVAAARAHAPLGILLDIGLPDHTGLTVLERLKRDPATRHIPVHVVSVHDDTRAALELGAAGYAVKPLRPDQVREALRRIEDTRRRVPKRVLVVEDDAAQRESVRALLAQDDLEIVGAETRARALELLGAPERFDCVVLDLGLPDGGGEAVLGWLAQGAQAPPPVIVYTGRELGPEEEARLRQRARSVVIKGARSPERLLSEVALFLHRVEADLPPEHRRILAQARRRDAVLEGRRILVVDDDVRSVFALTATLEPRGAEVSIARNGREALEVLDRVPGHELVLMDVMMPELDGYAAMRRIRADPRFARLPIIALTARAMPDDRERCLAAGANEYLAKPFDPDRLLSLVRIWLPARLA